MDTSFSLLGMLETMNWVARGVVIVLLAMSIWSLTIAVERLWRFQKAKRQSLDVAFKVTPLLKMHKLEDAIVLTSAGDYRHSHLARVLRAGLTEFQYETSQSLPEDFDLVASGQRAIEREALMTTAEMKKGLGNLATISTTALGLFVAIPAVWMYNYFLNKVDRFQVEMSNSSSQLIDYFIKNEARVRSGGNVASIR